MFMTYQTSDADSPLGDEPEETSLQVNDLSLFYGENKFSKHQYGHCDGRKVTALLGLPVAVNPRYYDALIV